MRTYTSCCGSLLLYQCCRDVNVWNVIRSCGVVGKTPGGPCRHDDVSFVTTHLFQEEYILGEGVPLDPPARGRVVLERDSHHITIRMRGFPAVAAGTHFFLLLTFCSFWWHVRRKRRRRPECGGTEEEELWVCLQWKRGWKTEGGGVCGKKRTDKKRRRDRQRQRQRRRTDVR